MLIAISHNLRSKKAFALIRDFALMSMNTYPLKVQKCCSIVPRGAEKAGKKFLTSYPLFVATCLPAVKLVCFQTFLIGGWQNGAPSSFFTSV